MNISRRRALWGSATAVFSVATLAACGTESDALAQQAGSGKGYVSGTGVITQLTASQRGEPIDVKLALLDGTTTTSAAYRPKLVALNLWYAACPPCRKEAPVLNAVSKEFAKDVQFIGVNVRDAQAAADGFRKTFNVNYPSVLDTDGAIVAALSGILPPQATPSTVILDADGRPAARVVGSTEESTLKGLIEDTLGH